MKPKEQPPRWANRFLRWYCPVLLLEEIEGDLYENFYRNLKRKGVRSARLCYIIDTIRFCNPVTFRRAKARQTYYSSSINITAMLRSFFIAAIRNLNKHKAYTTINVLGLALGVACCVTIFVLVRFEVSFDDFHSKEDRIYRVNLNQQNATGRQLNGYNFYPVGEAIRAEVSGLDTVTSMHYASVYQFRIEEDVYEGEHAFFVDSAYFQVFDGHWLLGNPERALTGLNNVVVTNDFANKYLGGIEEALDATFIYNNKLTLRVTGVVQSPPHNTDMPYSILVSYPSLAEFLPQSEDNWEWVNRGATFIALDEGVTTEQVDAQLAKIIPKYLTEENAQHTSFFLMPLADNHDRNGNYNNFTYEFPLPLMIILSVIAGMIAFIACINFINLATAQSLNRAREVGIRKTMGSSRMQLIVQYMSETLVVTVIAVLCGLALAKIPMRIMNTRAGREYLDFDFFQEPSIVLFLLGITLLLTLLAGFFPAFVLSGFRPVKALQGKISTGKPKGLNLRRALVITQFLGAQILILVTVIVVYQLNQFKERPLGFDAEAIIFTWIPDSTKDLSVIRQQLLQNPNIEEVTMGWGGAQLRAAGMQFYGDEGEDAKSPGIIHYGDEHYLNMFDRELLAGQNFAEGQVNPVSEVIVNETLVEGLGVEHPEEAVGRLFTMADEEVMIRGVIEDFYTEPLSNKVQPLVLQYDPDQFKAIAVKIAPTRVTETLQFVETTWKNAYPEYLYDYQFLDEALQRQYGFFEYILGFLRPFSFLAIFIGCMGL
ncbi:MAG: ABC transporter permease [Cyclobacteriaceae bacterium]